VSKVEGIFQRLFSGRYRLLANGARLPVKTTSGIPGHRQ
jgi:hypothetical protein